MIPAITSSNYYSVLWEHLPKNATVMEAQQLMFSMGSKPFAQEPALCKVEETFKANADDLRVDLFHTIAHLGSRIPHTLKGEREALFMEYALYGTMYRAAAILETDAPNDKSNKQGMKDRIAALGQMEKPEFFYTQNPNNLQIRMKAVFDKFALPAAKERPGYFESLVQPIKPGEDIYLVLGQYINNRVALDFGTPLYQLSAEKVATLNAHLFNVLPEQRQILEGMLLGKEYEISSDDVAMKKTEGFVAKLLAYRAQQAKNTEMVSAHSFI